MPHRTRWKRAFASLTKPSDAKLPAQSKLPPRPVLYRSYTRLQLAGGDLPHTEFGDLLAHSYTTNGGWYVRVVPAAFQMGLMKNNGTTHFTPYSYDRHVPLGFYGAPFATGIYHGRVEPVDLAATFASLLGVNQASASVGHILTQALKPASEVTYPKPVPVRSRRGTRAAEKTPAEKAPAKISNGEAATVKPDMKVRFAGIELRNPVIAASGTFAYGIEFEDIVSLDKIGGFVTKGLSREPMAGNQAPRIIETAAGMINAIGLQNIGVKAFIETKLPALARYPSCGIIANVFGYEVDDYIAVIDALNEAARHHRL